MFDPSFVRRFFFLNPSTILKSKIRIDIPYIQISTLADFAKCFPLFVSIN